MPKRIVPLADLQLRTAKPQEKEYKLFDGGGLFLLLTPSGGKLWRLKYRFGGMEKLLSLGQYPQISLVDARREREEAKELIAKAIDPATAKKAAQASKDGAGTFEAVAREWIERSKAGWSDSHYRRTLRNLGNDVFPWIGSRPVGEITPQEMMALLRRIEVRTLETAHKVKIACSLVFRYAVQNGRGANTDPTRDLKGALAALHHKRMAAPVTPEGAAPLLRAIDAYRGSFRVRCALMLAPLLFVRPVLLAGMEWADIDFNKAEWRVRIEQQGTKKKTREKEAKAGEIVHIAPLSRQALSILQELYQLTGNEKHAFPNVKTAGQPMRPESMRRALRIMGFENGEITPHGFRHMASSLLHEKGFPSHLIEKQLSHADQNKIRAVYNYAEHLPERRKMMQEWADYLDHLKAGEADKVVPIRAAC